MNVHDKNLLTISRMTRAEPSIIDDLLQNIRVGISVPIDATPSEWLCAKTAVNLLIRLYPRIYIGGSEHQVEELTSIMLSICPSAEVVTTVSDPLDVLLVVGQAAGHCDATNRFYVDSDGWQCRISYNCRTFSRSTQFNPLAAAAAACFAANEAFKVVFHAYLRESEVTDSFVLSLWDYSISDAPRNVPTPIAVDIGEVWLAGVGAVGNSFLYALSLLDDISGVIHCADNRNVAESNIQRYVLSKHEDIGQPKAEVALRIGTSRLHIDPIPKTIDTCFNEYGNIDTLICAVDTIQTRRDIQARLPRLILNAWTRMDEFAVTRHIFGSPYRCLSCLYDKGQVKDQRDNIAEATGLSLTEVTTLMRENTGLSMDEIIRIEQYRALPTGSLHDWLGRTVQSMYQEGVCGGQVVATDTGEETVPIAHTSALAGILLAAELVKERLGVALEHKVSFDMSIPPHQYLAQPELKAKNSTCICSDDMYLKAYTDVWGTQAKT